MTLEELQLPKSKPSGGALPSYILRLVLPMPHKNLSPNSRTHWAARARAVKNARDCGKWAAQKCLDAAKLAPPKWAKAHYTVTFYCRTAAKRDDDNLMASLKSYRDGIADSGLVADDAGMWAQGCKIEKDANNPRCEFVIWEVEA